MEYISKKKTRKIKKIKLKEHNLKMSGFIKIFFLYFLKIKIFTMLFYPTDLALINESQCFFLNYYYFKKMNFNKLSDDKPSISNHER